MPNTSSQQASLQNLPIPEKFSGSNGPEQSELWPKWIRRFERYRHASGLINKSAREQVSTLLYAMGECADDILLTKSITEETASYDEVKKALDDHYAARQNVIVERAKFNKRSQKQGESIDDFIQDLYRLAENCQYGTLKMNLFVIGLS